MTEETRGNIIQGITIAQKHLQHAQSTKPNEDFIVLPVNTARHLESILEQVLRAIAKDTLTDVKTEETESRKHIEELYEKALDGIRNYASEE